MRYTLLDLTQSVLSSMDSDEVNSINDTVESQQVAEVIKTVYDDIVSRSDLEKNKVLFNLVASTDLSKPVVMTKPSNIDRIDWIKYSVFDITPDWSLLYYLPPEDFLRYVQEYNASENYVDTFIYKSNSFETVIPFRNDVSPHYYTSFEDEVIVFDSYDARVEATLQSSNTLCFGNRTSDFVKQDSYTPNLQPQQFALLLNEAKSLAWAELKQTAHPKAEQSARRNWTHLQKTRNNIPDSTLFNGGAHPIYKLPNFARRR